MYIDTQIKLIKIFWPPITEHTYERISRPKWRIQLHYECGAEMTLDNQPDDLIQCLVLGAFNTGYQIESNVKVIAARPEGPPQPLTSWKELQPVLLEE